MFSSKENQTIDLKKTCITFRHPFFEFKKKKVVFQYSIDKKRALAIGCLDSMNRRTSKSLPHFAKHFHAKFSNIYRERKLHQYVHEVQLQEILANKQVLIGKNNTQKVLHSNYYQLPHFKKPCTTIEVNTLLFDTFFVEKVELEVNYKSRKNPYLNKKDREAIMIITTLQDTPITKTLEMLSSPLVSRTPAANTHALQQEQAEASAHKLSRVD